MVQFNHLTDESLDGVKDHANYRLSFPQPNHKSLSIRPDVKTVNSTRLATIPHIPTVVLMQFHLSKPLRSLSFMLVATIPQYVSWQLEQHHYTGVRSNVLVYLFHLRSMRRYIRRYG